MPEMRRSKLIQGDHKGYEMTLFIARVELRGNPTSNDYKQLHKLMADEFGFTEGIWEQSGLDREFRSLPHATYAGDTEGSAEGLRIRMEKKIKPALHFESIIFVAPIPAGSSTTPS
jgi:hypothetical protein